MTKTQISPTKLLRLSEIVELYPFSRSFVYYHMKRGNFPKPVKIGPRAVAWKLVDIEDWINSRQSD